MGDQPDFFSSFIPGAGQYTPYQVLTKWSNSDVALPAASNTAFYVDIPNDGFTYSFTKVYVRFTCKGPTEVNVAYSLLQAPRTWLTLGRKVGELSVEFDMVLNPVFKFVYPNSFAFVVNNEVSRVASNAASTINTTQTSCQHLRDHIA